MGGPTKACTLNYKVGNYNYYQSRSFTDKDSDNGDNQEE